MVPLSTVTITGSWLTPSNTPAAGQVVITPLVEVTGGGSIVADVPVVVPLVAGAISATLVNNTQATNLQYQITEQIVGAPTVIYVVVPVGATLDLSTVPRVAATSVTLNPNWPLMAFNADFTQGPPNWPGVSSMSLNAAARRTAVTQVQISRGRQYELDQVQAGTATITIVDPLEQLHPSNGSSPFNTGGNTITAYRCVQIGAWWNTATGDVTGNLLQTTTPIPGEPLIYGAAGYQYGFDPSWENWYLAQLTTGGTTIAVSTDHTNGTHTVWKIVNPLSVYFAQWIPRAVAGSSYTVTVDVWATTGQQITLGWTGSATASTTITGNSAFQTMTLSFTPAAADFAVPALLEISATSGSFPATFYVSNWQVTGRQPGWGTTGGPTMKYATVAPHTGQYHLSVSAPASSNTVTVALPTVPAITYTMSAYVQAVGSGTVATLTIGSTTSSTTTTGSYQRLQVSFTAADAVTVATLSVTGSSYPAVYYVDDMQLELGTSASTFSTAGPTWFPLYTGYIERFPLQWDMQGTRGVRPLTCVDALSILSRTEISQSYTATIAADTPLITIPYNDSAPPQTVTLPQGGTTFTGYQHLGTQGAVNFQGDTFLDGSPAVTVTQQNTSPVGSNNTAYITYLGTTNGTLAMSPQSFTIEVWARLSAGSAYFGAGALTAGEAVNTEPFGPTNYIGWYSSNGFLKAYYKDPLTSMSLVVPQTGTFPGTPDGQWHYFAVRCTGSNHMSNVVDNIFGGTGTFAPAPTTAVLINNLFVDAQTYLPDPACTLSVANLAIYGVGLSNTQILSHYNRGAGYVNEVAGARVNRLLQQYWGGPVFVDAGYRHLASDFSYNGRFVLDVLQEIQETERGLVYATAAGVVRFEDSTARYIHSPTPLWVFGENPAGASPVEYPYSNIEQVLDPTYTFTQTNLTRPGNTAFAPLPNPLPANPPYGQRVLTQEVQVTTDYDLTQTSVFYLARYSKPVLRVETLVFNAAANPALWPVVLSLEISQQVTVKRRTSAGLTTTNNYYIERITHEIDVDRGDWLVTVQCSPVFNTGAWILGDSTYGVLGTTTIPVF